MKRMIRIRSKIERNIVKLHIMTVYALISAILIVILSTLLYYLTTKHMEYQLVNGYIIYFGFAVIGWIISFICFGKMITVLQKQKIYDENKDIKTEDIKTEDIKTEDIKTEDIKTEDLKTEDLKTEDLKIEDIKNQELNEYEYMHYAYSNMQEKTKIAILKKTTRKHIIYELLEGDYISQEQIEESMLQCGLQFNFQEFIVLVFKFSELKTRSNQYNENDIYLLKYAVSNIGMELFSADFYGESIENRLNCVTFILNGKNIGKDKLQQIQGTSKEIMTKVEEFFDAKLSVGIGSVIFTIDDLRKSYEEALTAVEYRMIFGIDSIIFYKDIVNQEEKMVEYPGDIEQLLFDSIKQANITETLKYIEAFIEIIQVGCVQDINLYLSQLGASLSRWGRSSNTKKVFENLNYKSFMQEMEKLELIEQKKSYLSQLIMLEIEHIGQDDQDKKKGLIGEVIKYTEENYSNAEFSIEELAEHIGYSSSHMRKLFKELYNSSPTEYLIHYRIDMAKKFLLETNETAKTISEKVGYLNTKYFYSVFKKITGSTTYQYREQNREQNRKKVESKAHESR